MEELFDTVLTVHVGLTAVVSGGIQEAIKRAVKGLDKSGRFHGGPIFSIVQALMPLLLGAGFGHLIIPIDDAIADPWILGILAGLFSSQAYNMIKPAAEAVFSKTENTQ